VEYIEGDHNADEIRNIDPDYKLENVRIEPPVENPHKIVAAPANYEDHIQEAIDQDDIPFEEYFSIEDYGYFLKASSSIIGPEDSIEIPFSDRRVDHEIELAFIIESDTKNVSSEEAWDNIFGYTILLDITVRGEQDRSNRKSYDTFTVLGPWVTVADEVPDPQNLDMKLEVNDVVKQESNTQKMIYSCADIVEYASIGATLETGDVITTGTPSGVSPISSGDTINATIEKIGSMSVDVD
jgi:2-keto-4-pentenoate hydratase/2-oxohepta-3-ene-1,7-dioic acid hydratase in catechol pathway